MTTAARKRGWGTGYAPAAPIFELTAKSSGGWTQVQYDRAVYRDGVTYFGYHDGQTGNNEVRKYTHATGVTSSAFVLHAALAGIEGTPDSHNAPVLAIRSDGRLLAMYAGHSEAQMRMRVTTNALPDISAWGAEVNIDSQLGKSWYSYPTVLVMDNGDMHLFFRDMQVSNSPSGTAVMCHSVSTDDGATWAAADEVFKRATYRPYWVLDTDGSRIDVHLIDGYPLDGSESPIKAYHFYWDGSWRTSDGTAIAGAAPFGVADLTEVYDGSDGDAGHVWDINTNGGLPVIIQTVDTGADVRYDYCRWTGLAWLCQEITTLVGVAAGGAEGAFDSADPRVVYLIDVVPGVGGEMFRYETIDGGATWTSRRLTYFDGVNGVDAPTRIRDHAPDLRCLWTKGTAVSYLDYDFMTEGSRI